MLVLNMHFCWKSKFVAYLRYKTQIFTQTSMNRLGFFSYYLSNTGVGAPISWIYESSLLLMTDQYKSHVVDAGTKQNNTVNVVTNKRFAIRPKSIHCLAWSVTDTIRHTHSLTVCLSAKDQCLQRGNFPGVKRQSYYATGTYLTNAFKLF